MDKLLHSPQDIENTWNRVLEKVRQDLSELSFKRWVEPTRLASLDESSAAIVVPDAFYADWIRDHYEETIRDALAHVTGDRPDLSFRIAPPRPAPTFQEAPSFRNSLPTSQTYAVNPRYTFDSFVIGPGNRFAHAAALAVSDAPARLYNPLFIYGSVGLGKTHLLHALAARALSKSTVRKVCFITSEKFTNHLITAIQTRSTPQFRNCYRLVDILLIDDIHFIAGKEATQEEFFHTFNALYDAHKQIVVTSDRPPRDIPGLENRLVSRFAWGLVTDIQPPDFETRVAILKKKMERETVDVPDEVVHFIAKRIKSNIRELEGALIRVVASSSLTGAAVDLKQAQDILRDTFTEEENKVSIETIQKRVADHFHLKVSDMRIKSRSKSIAYPRQVAMYLVRELTQHSFPEIGEYFGGRNHTTVLHGHHRIQREMAVNANLKEAVEAIRREIASNSC